jgi:hypothetical protein
MVSETIAAVNDVLRDSFGVVELPEDVSPSRLAR